MESSNPKISSKQDSFKNLMVGLPVPIPKRVQNLFLFRSGGKVPLSGVGRGYQSQFTSKNMFGEACAPEGTLIQFFKTFLYQGDPLRFSLNCFQRSNNSPEGVTW
jgi:hypothetical protein